MNLHNTEFKLAALDLEVFLEKVLGKGKNYGKFAEMFNAGWHTANTYFTMLSATYCTYTAEFLDIIRDNILPLVDDFGQEKVKVAVMYKYLMEYYGHSNTRFICPSTLADSDSRGKHSYPYTHGDLHTSGNMGLFNIFALINTNGKYLVKDFRTMKLCAGGHQLDSTRKQDIDTLKRIEATGFFTAEDLLLITQCTWKVETKEERLLRLLFGEYGTNLDSYPSMYNRMFPSIYAHTRTQTSYFNALLANPFAVLSTIKRPNIVKALKEMAEETIDFYEELVDASIANTEDISDITRLLVESLHLVRNETYLTVGMEVFFPVPCFTEDMVKRGRAATMKILTAVSYIGYFKKKYYLEREPLGSTTLNEVTMSQELWKSNPFQYPILDVSNRYMDSSSATCKKVITDAKGRTIDTKQIFSNYDVTDFIEIIHADILKFKEVVEVFSNLDLTIPMIKEMGENGDHVTLDPAALVQSYLLRPLFNIGTSLCTNINRVLARTIHTSEKYVKTYAMLSQVTSMGTSERFVYLQHAVSAIENTIDDIKLEGHVDLLRDIANILMDTHYHDLNYITGITSTASNHSRLQRSPITNIETALPFSVEDLIANLTNMLNRQGATVKDSNGSFMVEHKVVQEYLTSIKYMVDRITPLCLETFENFVDTVSGEELANYVHAGSNSRLRIGSELRATDTVYKNHITADYLNTRQDVATALADGFIDNISTALQMSIENIERFFDGVLGENPKFSYIYN